MTGIKNSSGFSFFSFFTIAILFHSIIYAGPITPTQAELAALKRVGEKIPHARFLWSSNRKLFHSSIKNWDPKAIKELSSMKYRQYNPRWSPDGRKIAFIQQEGSSVGTRSAWIMNSDFTGIKKIADNASLANWTPEGDALTLATPDGYKIMKYTLENQNLETIYDAKKPPYNGKKMGIGDAGYYSGELNQGGRFCLNFLQRPTHQIQIVDLQEKKYISSNDLKRGDCSPAWSPDGKFIIHTAKLSGQRPIYSSEFDPSGPSLKPSKRFCGFVTNKDYIINGQRLTWDNKWVIFYAWGKFATGGQEVYCWEVGDDEENIVRLTFETKSDNQADLYLFEPSETKPANQSLRHLKFTVKIHHTSIILSYTLHEPSEVDIDLYNMKGTFLQNIRHGEQTSGTHHLKYNLNQTSIKPAHPSAGMYIIRLTLNNTAISKYITLVK